MLFKPRAALRRRPVTQHPLALKQDIGERARAHEDGLHGLGPLLADQVIRVEPIGQKSECETAARLKQRQGGIDGAEGGLATSAVAIETENRFVRHAPQQFDLIFG